MFTKEELQLIVSLADMALRSQGLQAVNSVVPLASKCQELLSKPAEPEAESVPK